MYVPIIHHSNTCINHFFRYYMEIHILAAVKKKNKVLYLVFVHKYHKDSSRDGQYLDQSV